MLRLSFLSAGFILPMMFISPFSNASETAFQPSSGTLTLFSVLEEARHMNPAILAARKRWDAARARSIQEATLDKPRLDIERMYSPRSENPISGAEERNLAVSQEIPFPTTLYLRSRRAKERAAGAEAAYRAKEWEVLSQTQKAWSMLYMAHHAIHIYGDNAELMRQMARSAESRYASGSASQTDVLKAQTELSRMLNMLVTMEQEQETSRAMLNTLLNRPPEAPLSPPAEPSLSALKKTIEELQALALENRPELQEAKAELAQSRSSLTLARSEYLPDFMVGYRRRDMADGMDSHDAMLGLTVPLWFWKQNAMVREMRAEREMAEADFQSMKNMALYDVKNLLVRVQTAHRLVELYQTSILPQSRQALKVAQAGYQGGRASFLDMLDAARTLLTFRLEHYQHISEYIQYLADIERAVGVRLSSTGPGEREDR